MTVEFILFRYRCLSFIQVFLHFCKVHSFAHFIPKHLIFFVAITKEEVYCFLYANFISCYCTEFFYSLS